MTEVIPSPTTVSDDTVVEPVPVAPEAPVLKRVGERPGIFPYMRQLWRYRHFTHELINAELKQRTQKDTLGALWYVLAPLLQSGVYFIVFTVLLKTTKNVQNPVLFLSAGVFTFAFTSRGLVSTAKSVTGNLILVRSLRFPRMVMPMKTVGVEVFLLVPTFFVLTVIALATGAHPSVYWLLIPVSLVLQAGMIFGLGLMLARITTRATDVVQAMPFILRLWLYLSGVFYSFAHIETSDSSHPFFIFLLTINPMRAYIELVRDGYNGVPSSQTDWVVAIVWPIILLTVGYIFFWRAEDSYGR